jgi:hypothetical protein
MLCFLEFKHLIAISSREQVGFARLLGSNGGRRTDLWSRIASRESIKQLLRALAESAFQASEAECAEKQQVGEEKIRRLELELVESRQRIETQAFERWLQ